MLFLAEIDFLSYIRNCKTYQAVESLQSILDRTIEASTKIDVVDIMLIECYQLELGQQFLRLL